MMPQDIFPDVERDRERNPLIGKDGLPMLFPAARGLVLAALGDAVNDKVHGFEALCTPKELLVTVAGEKSVHSVHINETDRGGLHNNEDVIAILGLFGMYNAARLQRRAA